jgi:hypothetical protein
MDYYTLEQLSKETGRTAQTLRWHIRNGWLGAEKIKGARGWRVPAKTAQKWAAKHLTISLP